VAVVAVSALVRGVAPEAGVLAPAVVSALGQDVVRVLGAVPGAALVPAPVVAVAQVQAVQAAVQAAAQAAVQAAVQAAAQALEVDRALVAVLAAVLALEVDRALVAVRVEVLALDVVRDQALVPGVEAALVRGVVLAPGVANATI